MQTFLTLVLGLSSLTSIYYSLVGKKAYRLQLKSNKEMEVLLKEVEDLKQDLVNEHNRIRSIAQKMTTGVTHEPVTTEEPKVADLRGKPWLN